MKLKIKHFLPGILPLFIFCSCKNNQKVAAVHTELFVTINGYDFTDTTTSLFLTYTTKEIIQLKCKTNLPANSRLVIRKGRPDDRTTNEADNDYMSDTVTVNNPEFTVMFSPHYMNGFVNFSVWSAMQPDSIMGKINSPDIPGDQPMYYSEYRIDYVNSKGENGLALPVEPIKLNIEKVK